MEVRDEDALIVVDMQNDFAPGGALAVQEADRIVPTINDLTARFDNVVYTRDWHPPNHCSFADDPEFRDMSWPRHCVQNTPGSDLVPGLKIRDGAEVVSKGDNPDKEAYSGFQDTQLAERLRDKGVKRVFVCGVATDYCVKNTALDSVRSGFDTVLIEDAVRGVDQPAGSAAEAVREMERAGVARCSSDDLKG